MRFEQYFGVEEPPTELRDVIRRGDVAAVDRLIAEGCQRSLSGQEWVHGVDRLGIVQLGARRPNFVCVG